MYMFCFLKKERKFSALTLTAFISTVPKFKVYMFAVGNLPMQNGLLCTGVYSYF